MTCTAGWMGSSGSVVLGWTVNPRCSGGFSVKAVASQLLGELKYQVHRGSTVPALVCTA